MTQTLARHGTRAGYEAELKTGNICDRCRAAKRVYQRQFTKSGRASGVKYGSHDVIDHLDKPANSNRGRPLPRLAQTRGNGEASARQQGHQEELPSDHASDDTLGPYTVTVGRAGPSLADRIKGLVMPEEGEYVPTDDIPEYLHTIEPDAESSLSDWEEVPDAEFVINAAGMRKIEENLGTYLSVVGITVEMIDPYCGGIAAQNFDNMVTKWSRVISHYPAAAKLFLDSKGGTLFAWMGAIQATWPVLYAIYEHHFARTVRTENGRVYRQNQKAPDVDATMPPMDNYEYSAG